MVFPGFNRRKKGSISNGDWDRDGVKNSRDCDAMNWKKQDGGEVLIDYSKDLLRAKEINQRRINEISDPVEKNRLRKINSEFDDRAARERLEYNYQKNKREGKR